MEIDDAIKICLQIRDECRSLIEKEAIVRLIQEIKRGGKNENRK